MKKLLSVFLPLVMLLCITAGLSFTAQAATEIKDITIQEVVIPRPGATPSTNWSKTGNSWYANEIKWYEVPSSGYDILLSGDSKFVEGKKYKAVFIAWTNSGYDFAATSSINATIDGFKASVTQYSGRDSKRVVSVSYTFTCEYKEITSVVLNSDPFEKGTVLTTDFFYAQGEGVNELCVSTFTRNGESISIGEKVTYGDYGASVILAPLENYKFADNVSVTMGNKVFTVVYRIGMGIVVKSPDNLWQISCEHPNIGNYEYDVTTHWKSCQDCGDKTVVDIHTFNETVEAGNTVYTCSTCNYTKTAANKVNGYLYADVTGGVQIIAYDGSETNLIVPSALGEKTVVSIGEYAFAKYSNKTTFTSIILPSTVTSIGKGAFNGCTALTSVNIPSGVKRIEAETFLGCGELKSITIPYGVNFIGEGAFQGGGIYSIVIPCSVKTIKGSAFRSCTNLGNIIIPDSVTELGNAFLSCSALESVVIGSGITSITQATFDGCTALKTLTLPVELISIGKYNFDAGRVTTINYRGTEDQFNAINISTNTDLTSATKNYSYNEKTDIGQHKYIAAQTVAPTCVDEGYTLNMCEGCGDVFRSNITKETGIHTYNSGAITTDPGCESKGVKTYLCKDCGIAKTEPVNALGHTGGTATCKDKLKCTRCGVAFGSLKAHTYKSVTTKATLSKNGKVENKCSVCGDVKSTKTIYYPKTIKLSSTSYTYNGKVKTPTVTVKDSKGNTLKKDTDYTVTYESERKNAGKYAVTITFKGNYSGTKTLYFNILPSKTSKITPTNTTTSIKATWKKVTGATGYKVELLNSKGKVLKTATTTKLTYTFKKLSKVTTYKIRVTAYKTIDSKKVYSTASTTITTSTAPAKVILSTVTAGSKQATLAWKTVSGASGYEVQYSTSSEFKSAKTATVKKGSTKKTTIKKLTKGKKYYFKVRAYKTIDGNKVYGAWSSAKSVKVK